MFVGRYKKGVLIADSTYFINTLSGALAIYGV